jgi:DNA-binding PadR family transcriptional regulator
LLPLAELCTTHIPHHNQVILPCHSKGTARLFSIFGIALFFGVAFADHLGGDVSVRHGLLAILTIGPAYGFQLHGELQSRTASRRSVNVGQIYSTLDRLGRHGAIKSAGSTPDGLPLYQLTEDGRTEAMAWLHETASATGEEWNDLIDRVLIASSLPGVDVLGVISRYRRHWGLVEDDPSAHGQTKLARAAHRALARAAIAWLDETESTLRAAGEAEFRRELAAVRPRKGRPAAVS